MTLDDLNEDTAIRLECVKLAQQGQHQVTYAKALYEFVTEINPKPIKKGTK